MISWMGEFLLPSMCRPLYICKAHCKAHGYPTEAHCDMCKATLQFLSSCT